MQLAYYYAAYLPIDEDEEPSEEGEEGGDGGGSPSSSPGRGIARHSAGYTRYAAGAFPSSASPPPPPLHGTLMACRTVQ